MLVTAVIGSYRKGNTYRVVQRMADRLAGYGVEVRYLFVSEIDLKPCKGCFLCLRRGEERCPLKDGLPTVEKQLLESDGAIFASPNYACGVTSQMRRLIERFAYIGHRPRFFGRYAVVVATSGGPVGIKKALDDLSYFGGGGFRIVGRLGLMTPPVKPSPEAEKRDGKRINACADKLYRAITSKKEPRPTFGGILQFSSFRGMYRANPPLGEAMFPADMDYWREKGWLDKRTRYYRKVPLGPVKFIVGKLLEKVLGIAAKGMRSGDVIKQ